MSTVIITGSSGVIGGEAVDFFSTKFDNIIGIDNNLRSYFFGKDSSTIWNKKRLEKKHANFISENIDIRSYEDLEKIFKKYNSSVKLVIHTAAQPSHDWAAKEPITDFSVNAI